MFFSNLEFLIRGRIKRKNFNREGAQRRIRGGEEKKHRGHRAHRDIPSVFKFFQR
jgi:hypothetical protein